MNPSSSSFGVKLGVTCLEDRVNPVSGLLSSSGLNGLLPPTPPPPPGTGPIVVILPPGSGGQSNTAPIA